MSTATIEIYRTESGSVYEVYDGRVRRHARDHKGAAEEWTPYVAISRIPAAVLRPGTQGEVLEIVLRGGRRIYTSRITSPRDDRPPA